MSFEGKFTESVPKKSPRVIEDKNKEAFLLHKHFSWDGIIRETIASIIFSSYAIKINIY